MLVSFQDKKMIYNFFIITDETKVIATYHLNFQHSYSQELNGMSMDDFDKILNDIIQKELDETHL